MRYPCPRPSCATATTGAVPADDIAVIAIVIIAGIVGIAVVPVSTECLHLQLTELRDAGQQCAAACGRGGGGGAAAAAAAAGEATHALREVRLGCVSLVVSHVLWTGDGRGLVPGALHGTQGAGRRTCMAYKTYLTEQGGRIAEACQLPLPLLLLEGL